MRSKSRWPKRSARKVQKVGLLRTFVTMTSTFFQKPVAEAAIEVIKPDAVQIAYVQDRIEAELEHRIVTEATRVGLIDIIREMRERSGIEQIILGLHRITVILNDDNSPVPCLDKAKLHVRALIDLSIGEEVGLFRFVSWPLSMV